MRMMLMLLLGLAIGGAMLYFFSTNQLNMQAEVMQKQSAAQEKADAYRKNQEKMMKELQQ